MNKPTVILLLGLVVMATLGVSCQQGTVFSQYDSIASPGWERNDTISFRTDTMPAAGTYRPEVGMRINGTYPYMDLSIIVEQTRLPSGQTRTDTLNCHVIDKTGRPLGQGVNLYQYLFPLPVIQLEQGDVLHVTIRHCMNREILPGISDVGLKLSAK